jgi:DNA gyrase subunit A
VGLAHPDASREELLDALLERIKGPDFPMAGLIVGTSGIEQAYRTGRGSIMMRAVVSVEEEDGRTVLIVTELPYQVNPDNLALKIAELADSAGSRASPTSVTTPPTAPVAGWS